MKIYCIRQKKKEPFGSISKKLLGSEGFEPTKENQQIYSLPPLTTRETPQIQEIFLNKAAAGIRTQDLEITNHALYQLSYSGLFY